MHTRLRPLLLLSVLAGAGACGDKLAAGSDTEAARETVAAPVTVVAAPTVEEKTAAATRACRRPPTKTWA
jgi:hypothetical protein